MGEGDFNERDNMTISILINGAFGKMGLETVKAVEQDASLTLVGQIGRGSKLAQVIMETQPEVVIDFTTPEAVFDNALTIIEAGKHPVIGTTGLSNAQIDTLKARCAEKKLGGIIAPNFAIGVILMMKFASEAIRYFPQAEIIELHHDAKRDTPSGTAIKTAQMMAKNRDNLSDPKAVKETILHSRGAQCEGIPIHAVRLPGLVAHEMILFGGQGEVLTIKHDAMDRKCFMAGVLLACKKVVTLNELIYGLEHLL
jgi:4-hydroxy-tetrahydrodipicolinate reductase